MLAGQGIVAFDPLHKDWRTRLNELKTGDGRRLPAQLKAELQRELARVELVLDQIETIEAERDAAIAQRGESALSPVAALARLASGPDAFGYEEFWCPPR